MQPKSLLYQDERNFIFSWDRCLYRKNSCARPYGLKRVSRLLPFTPVRPHQASLFILPPDIIPSIYGSSHPLSSPTEVATSSLTIPELIHLISDSCLTIDSFRHPPTHPPAHTRKKKSKRLDSISSAYGLLLSSPYFSCFLCLFFSGSCFGYACACACVCVCLERVRFLL